MGELIHEIKDGLGTAGVGKYGFQATRAAMGLSTTTPLTAAFDLASGATSLNTAHNVVDIAKGASTATKGVTGAANLSNTAKIAGFASKAAPVVAKGSAALGVALGAFEVGGGIKEVMDGNSEKGKEKIVNGSCDMITAGALGVAATSSATVVGVPVAAVALGVAAVAQGVKYRNEIADGVKFAGNKLSEGAHFMGDKIGDVAHASGDRLSSGFKSLKRGIGGLFD